MPEHQSLSTGRIQLRSLLQCSNVLLFISCGINILNMDLGVITVYHCVNEIYIYLNIVAKLQTKNNILVGGGGLKGTRFKIYYGIYYGKNFSYIWQTHVSDIKFIK